MSTSDSRPKSPNIALFILRNFIHGLWSLATTPAVMVVGLCFVAASLTISLRKKRRRCLPSSAAPNSGRRRPSSSGVFAVTSPDPSAPKRMRLRYAGTCRTCGGAVAAHDWADYHRTTKQIECLQCADAPTTAVEGTQTSLREALPEPEIEAGVAGASARREHERRMSKREDRIRAAHPVIGGFLLAVTDQPQSTTAWARGAVGEERLGQRLDTLSEHGVRVLHDRRIPGTRANIDHIAVSAAGVFVIDAKRYKGRPDLRVQGGLLRPRTETLIVGARDCTKLVHGVIKQVDVVRAVLDKLDRADVPVAGMLCFVEADWPLIGGAFRIDGVQVLWPRLAAERLCADGDLSPEDVAAIHRNLASALPRA